MGTLLELLPPGSAVAADGTLTIAGCRADELAEKFGTPVMIVDEPALRRRVRPVLVAPRVGDLLVVPATGAYCFTMANNDNGARRIPVVFANDGAARLVVRRETWEELSERDVE